MDRGGDSTSWAALSLCLSCDLDGIMGYCLMNWQTYPTTPIAICVINTAEMSRTSWAIEKAVPYVAIQVTSEEQWQSCTGTAVIYAALVSRARLSAPSRSKKVTALGKQRQHLCFPDPLIAIGLGLHAEPWKLIPPKGHKTCHRPLNQALTLATEIFC